jgi:hypothetical protein
MAYESFPGAKLDDITASALRDMFSQSPAVKASKAAVEQVADPTHHLHASQAPLEKPFPAYIDPRWRAVAHMRIKDFASWRDCAAAVGVNYVTVLAWSKKPLYRAYEAHLQGAYLDSESSLPVTVREKREQVRVRIEDNAGEMFDRLLTILDTTGDAKLQASIAQDLLDRAGVQAVQERTMRHVHQINDTKLQELFDRAREIGQPIIDVKAVPAPDDVGPNGFAKTTPDDAHSNVAPSTGDTTSAERHQELPSAE